MSILHLVNSWTLLRSKAFGRYCGNLLIRQALENLGIWAINRRGVTASATERGREGGRPEGEHKELSEQVRRREAQKRVIHKRGDGGKGWIRGYGSK